MEDSVLCSIIVMVYNRTDNLKTNLCSIANQSYKNYEVIIQDDGSIGFDYCYVDQCVQEAGLSDVTRIYHNEHNIGTVKNYNSAIERTKGEIIVPLSQDDAFYDESVLYDICKCLEDSHKSVCYGKRISDDGTILPLNSTFEFFYGDTIQLLMRESFQNIVFGATLYFKKSIWQKYGGFDDRYVLLEDYPFTLKLLKAGETIVPLDRICIKYSEKGVSSKGNRKSESKSYRLLRKDVQTLYDNEIKEDISRFDSPFVRDAFHYRWLIGNNGKESARQHRFRKAKLIIRYPIISIIRKYLNMKHGREESDIFVLLLYKMEMKKKLRLANKS